MSLGVWGHAPSTPPWSCTGSTCTSSVLYALPYALFAPPQAIGDAELHRQHLHLIGCKTKFNQDKQVCVCGGGALAGGRGRWRRVGGRERRGAYSPALYRCASSPPRYYQCCCCADLPPPPRPPPLLQTRGNTDRELQKLKEHQGKQQREYERFEAREKIKEEVREGGGS